MDDAVHVSLPSAVFLRAGFWRETSAGATKVGLRHGYEAQLPRLSVSADVKLTHCAKVKVTHLGHDGSLL
ncbi:hypothetical protein, partial [Paracidovorax avenae]|uniref:hypothetical protein n=1 Tax=Paracidovorax avenae TaxID=80867 RepID=UPI001CEF5921